MKKLDDPANGMAAALQEIVEIFANHEFTKHSSNNFEKFMKNL